MKDYFERIIVYEDVKREIQKLLNYLKVFILIRGGWL